MPTLRFTARIRNGGSAPLGLQVEPWGEYYRIEPGAFADIQAEGPGLDAGEGSGLLKIEHAPELVTVYAWSGAMFTVVGAEPAPWPEK
ncbi:hypothetical protein HPC49_05545 [Pyxidicoccus fallax]|uniref:Uncharacterized protein n=1 Tax=Pyxidicoccus fallax TaxID=394095 RepID=A0A848LID9_9BACT|nr:hypothetical protein [Pyxidicoccus fallax]NMO17487.1 hypothetical protein [Pyxidicoccus fallax]NPC77718.1 hypothetical protein [Pyxidicoccus fallax]